MAEKAEYRMDGVDTMMALLLAPLGWLYGGWVALMLWRWFLIPLGAPVVGFWHILGIGVFVRLYTYAPSSNKWADESAFYAALALPLVRFTIALLVGVVLRGIIA